MFRYRCKECTSEASSLLVIYNSMRRQVCSVLSHITDYSDEKDNDEETRDMNADESGQYMCSDYCFSNENFFDLLHRF